MRNELTARSPTDDVNTLTRENNLLSALRCAMCPFVLSYCLRMRFCIRILRLMDGPLQCFLAKMWDLHRRATPSDKRSGFSFLKWASLRCMMLTCATNIFGEYQSTLFDHAFSVYRVRVCSLEPEYTTFECAAEVKF